MFASLVKIKKYLIYFFLFLFFHCFFSVSIKAAETTFVRSKAVNGNNVQFIRGVTFNPDGDKMFVAGGRIGQYTLDDEFNIQSFTQGASLNPTMTGPQDIRFSNDGMTLIVTPHGSDPFKAFNLGTAYDPTSQTSSVTKDLTDNTVTVGGLAFNSDGTRMFLTDKNGGSKSEIDEYSLSVGFDISSRECQENV